MEQSMKYICVVLAIALISLNVTAQPLASTIDNEVNSKLPPLIFPKENVRIGDGLPPAIFPDDEANSKLPPLIILKDNVTIGAGPPPLLFPTENVTIGVGLPPAILPTENVTIGEASVPIENVTDRTKKLGDIPPLIFPTTNGSVPLIKLPPFIFPEDSKTPINKTALDILNAVGSTRHEDMHILLNALNEDYYREDSSDSDNTDEVEEVQPNDTSPQKDNLEENFKSEMNQRSSLPEIDDNTEVDHPMLKNSHILGVIGAVLVVLCICLYVGITTWRRIMFNRYGMRERLINEDDFYSNKSIRHNFI